MWVVARTEFLKFESGPTIGKFFGNFEGLEIEFVDG